MTRFSHWCAKRKPIHSSYYLTSQSSFIRAPFLQPHSYRCQIAYLIGAGFYHTWPAVRFSRNLNIVYLKSEHVTSAHPQPERPIIDY